MKILGIDPGLAICGYAIIETNPYRIYRMGSIQTEKGQLSSSRLNYIACAMEKILSTYQPDEIAIEQLFFSKNTTTALQVSQARGVIILKCSQYAYPMYEYKPNEIKKSITGYGHATKQQIIQLVKKIFNLSEAPKPDDVADAVAIALCHSNHQNLAAKTIYLQQRRI